MQVVRFNIRCTARRGLRAKPSTSNHLRKVDRGRSASDGNKRGVKLGGSQPKSVELLETTRSTDVYGVSKFADTYDKRGNSDLQGMCTMFSDYDLNF